ncbi:MAG TPA: LysR substrate-binding domain-containing protein [Advenella sp.]|nr:LysR substrate-binding domain-containing protein [Advenella sp.]
MKLDGRLLVSFCVLAEELHFGKAASRLSVSQPPLSRQIRQLEEWVGTPLFLRSTRSVSLTAAGAVMYEQARRICADMEYMLQTARQIARGSTGSLSIGITPSAANSPLVGSLHSFRRDHPGIQLDLQEMDSIRMTDALLARQLDIALMRPIVRSDKIHITTVYEEPIGLVTRTDHVVGGKTVRLTDIVRHPLVGYDESVSPYFATMLAEVFASSGLTPNIVQKSRLPSILTLVEAGVGLAIVPQSMARSRADILRWIPIEDNKACMAKIVLAVERAASNPVIHQFVGSLLRKKTTLPAAQVQHA